MECWGPYLTENFAAEGQYTYINLIVAHWYSEPEVGELSNDLLRATAAYVFASAPGRLYWQKAGGFWRDNYSGRRARRFHRALEEAYQEAIKKPASRPPAPVVHEPEPVRGERTSARQWLALLAAAGGGAAAVLVVVRAIRHVARRH